jgi:DNA repair exonuclease SbcCD nuclease subunit
LPFRFVHTADIHLDSPLRSLVLRDPALAERIGNATRTAFTRIIDLCLEEQVDALLIAGDLYDGEQTSMKTALFLARELARLDAAGIRTFVIRGNHDAMSKITAELVLPDSVKVFGGRAEAMPLEGTGGPRIVMHGISFRESRAPESLLPRYRPPVEGAVNIGLMHTSLGGTPGHDVYAPCSLADLEASGFRYWALGHIHKRSLHAGRCTAVMPGIPQGRDINEAGAGSVSLVTVSDDGTVSVEERVVASARFDRLAVDLSGETDWTDAVGRVRQVLSEAAAAESDLHRVVRLSLAGATPLAWRLRRELDLLAAEAQHQAERIGGTTIEKVETACIPLETKSYDGTDPVAELARIIEDDVLASAAFRNLAEETVNDLTRGLPPELRGLLGQNEAEFMSGIDALAREGVETVLARLRDTAGAGER